jgi:hypothetical protein
MIYLYNRHILSSLGRLVTHDDVCGFNPPWSLSVVREAQPNLNNKFCNTYFEWDTYALESKILESELSQNNTWFVFSFCFYILVARDIWDQLS